MPALIATIGYPLDAGHVRGWPESGAVAVPDRYINALQRAGGREAVLMPGDIDRENASQIMSRFDGLLLVGGGDVDPATYEQDRHDETKQVFPQRDAFEIALTHSAIELGRPVLAICRGIQLLNVALGGSLVQHISSDAVDHGDVSSSDHVMHTVQIASGSKLFEALGVGEAICSSHHHQALGKIADSLTPVAWASDGLVEGVELSNGWVVGVQWHPEVTAFEDLTQQRLFDALVKRALAGL